MRSMVVFVGALALAGCASAGPGPQSASAKDQPVPYSRDPYPSTYHAYPGVPTLVTNVTIYDGEGGRIDNGQVLFADGKIVAIGQTVSAPAGAATIDGAGKWVMPGLADMHVHLWNKDELTLFLAAGVTTVRNMAGEPRQLTWRSQIAAGAWIGPTIVTAGPIIDGDPPESPGSAVLDEPADADKLVAEQKAAGYDFLEP
jgi:hypothetical protein